MAADDNDDRGATPDPWDEIVADSLGAEAGEISFRFEEEAAAPEPAADESETFDSEAVEATAEAAGSDGEGEAAEAAEHALVEDWLSGDEGDAGEAIPPLSVFTPEDAVGGSSAIDIGTGTSGVTLHGESEQEEIGTNPLLDGEASDADGADLGFAEVTAVGVAVAANAPAARRPSKPTKKAGGIGQIIGIVLGGLLAIPIVVGILIGYAWLGGRDTMGLAKTPLAFLMPSKSNRSVAAGKLAGGSALDALPTVPETVEPVAEPAEPDAVADASADAVADTALDASVPADLADAGVAPAPEPSLEPSPDPVPEPASEPAADAVVADAPALDALAALAAAAEPPAAVTTAEPPPLDTAALDEAVGDATALGEALGAVDDKENRAYTLLRTRWYRSLARVAEELVAVDDEAIRTGRPLAESPDTVAALHGGIGGREALVAELAALAPDWLAYAKRGSDGVVLPATFESARKVGPLWSVRVTFIGADGLPRDLTVISRREPTAVAGDRIMVTGVALDGTAIWAADVRATEPAAGL